MRSVLFVAAVAIVPAVAIAADDNRVHAKVGSTWAYTVTDQITGRKNISEQTVNEIKNDQIVLGFQIRGFNSHSIQTYDRNWNLIEGNGWKYDPNAGGGVSDSISVGDQRSTTPMASWQLQPEYSEPRPEKNENKVLSEDEVTVKAGKFDTYQIESVLRYNSPNQPLTVNVTTLTYWFAPKIDHWVKYTYEWRQDDRLVTKTSAELIEYKLKK